MLTAEEIHGMMRAGLSLEQISKKSSVPRSQLLTLLKDSNLFSEDANDPTVREIQEAAKEIRKSWSPQTEQSRWVGLKGYLRSPR